VTTRAAIIPGGYTSVVVATGDVPPLALLHAESWQVGALVPRAQPIRRGAATLTEERRITPVDVDACAARAIAIVLAHACEDVTIELARSKSATQSHALAQAIHDACASAGVAVRLTPSTWRRSYAHPRVATIAARAREDVTGWPARTYRVVEAAAGLLLHTVAPRVPEPGPDLVPLLARSLDAASRTLPLPFDGAAPAWSAPHAPAERAPVRVRAGLDSGARWVALVIAEGTRAPLRVLYARVYDVGAIERNRAGKLVHRVRSEHVVAIASEVVRVCTEHGVERIVSEHVDAPWHPDGEDEQTRRARERALNTTTWLEGSITTPLAVAGVDVLTVTQASARARVVGRAGGDAGVPGAIAQGFAAWPDMGAREGEHARDAGVCALYDVTAAPLRTRSGRRAKGSRAEVAARLSSARAEVRAAAGCTCPPVGRHAAGCKLAKATAQTCSKCGGPRRGHVRGAACPVRETLPGLDADAPGFAAEVNRRIEEHRRGDVESIPAEDVLAMIESIEDGES